MSLGVKALLIAIVLAAVAAAGYAAVSQYNAAIARAERLEGERDQATLAAEGWKASATFWQQEKDRADKTIAGRDRHIALISQQTKAEHAKTDELARALPDVRAWLDTPLPGPILEQLRSVATAPGTARDPAGKDPPEPAHDRPSATVARHH